jgi:hypothetical protein
VSFYGLDAAGFSCCCCCCGLFSGPAELGAVNPYAVHDHSQPAYSTEFAEAGGLMTYGPSLATNAPCDVPMKRETTGPWQRLTATRRSSK